MKRWLWRILLSIFGFVLLLCLGMFLLLWTEIGTQFLFIQAQQYVPALHVAQVRGNLLDRLELQGLTYTSPEVNFQSEQTVFAWHSSELLQGKLHLSELKLNTAKVKLPPSTSAPQPIATKPFQKPTLPEIKLPFTLQIDEVGLQKVSVQQGEQPPIEINSVVLQASAENDLNLQKIIIDLPQLKTELSGSFGLQSPHKINLNLKTTAKLPQINVIGNLQLTGDWQKITLSSDAEVSTPALSQPTYLTLKVQSDWEHATIEALDAKLLDGTLNLTGHAQWLPSVQADLTLKAENLLLTPFSPQQLPDNFRLNTNLSAELNGQKLLLKQLQLLAANLQINLHGTALLDPQNPSLDAQLTWENLHYPLKNTNKPLLVQSPQGNFKISGTPQAYQLQLASQIVGQNIPASHWKVEGAGDREQVHISKIHGDLLQGTLDIDGLLQWGLNRPTPQADWKFILVANKLDLDRQWANAPKQFSAELHTQGKLNEFLEAQVDLKHLQGQVQQYLLTALTQLSIKLPLKNPQLAEIKVQNLKVKSGDTQFTMQGEIAQNAALNWELNSPNLAQLVPQAHGKLSGKGSISGALTTPQLKAELHGQQLQFAENRLQNLLAKLEFSLQGNQPLFLQLDINEVQQGKNKVLERAQLKGTGTVGAHQLTADVILPQERIQLALQGGLNLVEQRWQGHIQNLKLVSKLLQTWQTRQNTALSLSAKQVQLAPLCLFGEDNAQLCLQATAIPQGQTSAKLQLSQINFNRLRQFLPPETQITGILNADVSANITADQRIDSKATVKISEGFIKTKIDDEVLQLNHQGGTVNLVISPQGLDAQLAFALDANNALRTKVLLPKFNRLPLKPNQVIQGDLQAHFNKFNLVPMFVPSVENVAGKLNANLQISGSLDNPQVKGLLQLQDANADVPQAGLQLKKLQLMLQGAGQDLQLNASVNSGAGQLRLQGKFNLPSVDKLNGNLSLQGERFEAVNMPFANALISPNLKIEIAPQKIHVQGEVTIPEATLSPPEKEGAVNASDDVVIVNKNANKNKPEPEVAPSAMAISSNVNLIFGDKISFKGAGFSTKIKGRLQVSNQPHKLTSANGELQLVDGLYKAYGQNLKIQRGRIFFTGGPIDNPMLDVRAVREVQDVTAGVKVSGTAQSPQIDLFSEPMLDQTNILSYIVLGKPASQATKGGDNQALLTAMASSAAMDQGDGFAKKIANDLGLDDAGIGSNTQNNPNVPSASSSTTKSSGMGDSALTVGKYLTPELYISYGIGLFDSSTIFKIRYLLSKRWTLETQTGTYSGVDLRYGLEN
ncbi:MAG: translocation/assembly module TamB domain-containing protein [Thiotrichaceae bacterium]|nr:translocation/assembly module TamB domain-containing protein [Thiotrichaceae bacterium]